VAGGTTLYRVDPLGDVLDLSRVRGALLCNVRAAAPWGLDVPGTGDASVHVVTSGTAWLRVGGDEPAHLMPGDVFLLPSGVGYRLSSTPDGFCERFDQRLKAQMTPERDLAIGGGGARTVFLCAEYVYDLDVAQPLMSLLPAVLRVPADPARTGRVAAIVELLAGEVGAHGPGSRPAVARLLDLLLIEAIRHWVRDDAVAGGPSWLTALRDPAIARVLALLHARPAEPWTLERLADEAHLSRATLARRFTEAVGESPLAYLTRWRMHLAAARLKHTSDTVEVIAREVGYTSEHAFNRAFARHRGHPPGRYRRLARTA
jgi:AraC-like DNA-binding protein